MSKLKVLCKASHNIEQIDNLPEYLVVEIEQAMLVQLKRVQVILQQANMHYAVRWWAVDSIMYQVGDDGDKSDIGDIDVNLEGLDLKETCLIEFETDYRLDGEHVKVHSDGDLIVFCPLKHSEHEEVWATIGNIDELLLRFTDSGDKASPVGVE